MNEPDSDSTPGNGVDTDGDMNFVDDPDDEDDGDGALAIPPTTLTVTGFTLINADTDMPIGPIADGDLIDITTLPTMNLNIRADATMDTESVYLELSGAQAATRTENVGPFALFGDVAGDYIAHVFAVGTYSLAATPYPMDGLMGMAGTGLNINFEFVNPTISSPLILVDSATDTPLMALTDGAVINKSVLGDLLFGVIFDPALDPQGVTFNLSGPLTENRVEGTFPPFSLFGDFGVDVQGKLFPPGAYTLMATPNNGSPVTVAFTVVDEDPACVAFDASIDSTTDPSTCGGSEGAATVSATGFAAPLTFEWSHDMGLNADTATGLTAGDYTVVVTDDNGCSETLMFTLNDPPLPVVGFTAPADVAIDAGVQAGLGGGTPVGGVYSGNGVTDDANGMTYSFDPAAAGPGPHLITYTYTDGNGCTGEASDTVTVIDTSVNTVISFTLVNADTDMDMITLMEGSVIDLSMIATTNLNIRANTTLDVESVQMTLSGATSKVMTENVAPYALFGDIASDYVAGSLNLGAHTLTATPYTADGLGGTAGTPLTINFTVTGGMNGFSLKLFPNPTVTEMEVEMVNTLEAHTIRGIQIHDINGRLVGKYDLRQVGEVSKYRMPTFGLQSGVYYITVLSSDGTLQQKPFVVKR